MHRFGKLSVVLSGILAGLIGAPFGFAQEGGAKFQVEMDITWSQGTAPAGFPKSVHLTSLIGATHNSKYVLFRSGHTASSGLELIAENGRSKTLKAEFAEAKRRRRLGTEIIGDSIPQVPGRTTTEFKTTEDHSLVSFVTMIAPSPDWFTGAADIPLMRDDAWIDSVDIPLWAWDSGTDSGPTFTSKNQDMQPQESIRLVDTAQFLTADGLVRLGTIRIKRITP